MGLHFHKEISRSFWGEFTRSLYNGLSRQIIVTRILQPLKYNSQNTSGNPLPVLSSNLVSIVRLERLARMAGNLECRITFHRA